MPTDAMFYLTNFGLGVALAADAFSVSLANGLNEPRMKLGKACGIAGMFGFFQALMPFIGWILLRTIVSIFQPLTALIPWIALILLGFIGGKMVYEGLKCSGEECELTGGLGIGLLLVQGIATSIDALSAGLNFCEYQLADWATVVLAAAIIAVTTFVICIAGVQIGKKTGTALSGKAGILGGMILILIGLWICISSFF